MTDYPDAIVTPRAVTNRPGVVFDANDTKTFYAEDYEVLADEIVAIETILGLNPEGIFTSVVDRLDDIEAAKEDIVNKSTNTALGTSDTYYPSQKAVKTYSDSGTATLTNKTIDNDNNVLLNIAATALKTGAFIVKEVTLGSTFSTSSDSSVDITGLSVTFSSLPSDGVIVAIVSVDSYNTANGAYVAVGLKIDGVNQNNDVNHQNEGGTNTVRRTMTTFAIKSVSSGSSPIVQAVGRRAFGGTAYFLGGVCHIVAVFIPKAST